MSNVIHLSKIRIVQEKRPKRRAHIADFPAPVLFGVHAGVAAFYIMIPTGKRPEAERALAVVECGCPVAQTLKGCVAFDYHSVIEEM